MTPFFAINTLLICQIVVAKKYVTSLLLNSYYIFILANQETAFLQNTQI